MNDDEDVDPRSEPRPGIPLGRPGHTDEVAALIAFLAARAGLSVVSDTDVDLPVPRTRRSG